MVQINCIVNFNNDGSGFFYTGNIVTGIIVLELKRDQKIERIDFEVIGTCKAQWTRVKPTVPYIKIYSEKKRLLSIKVEDIFVDVRNGKMMPAGVHRYPFHFVLPEDLPSTFNSSLGRTCYKLRIKSKPAFKIKKSFAFIVLENVNLNDIEHFLMPTEYDFQTKISCSSDTFEAIIRTFKAFAPKQRVPLEMILNNKTQVRISKIRITLIQKLRYTVSSGYLNEERKMYEISQKMFSNATAEVCYFNIDIPHVIPTSLNVTDPMICVTYSFRVEVIFRFHSSLLDDIPVTVATIPVKHHQF